MGMNKEIKVLFKPKPSSSGFFEDEIKVVSKYRIYTIPIQASIGDKGKEIQSVMN